MKKKNILFITCIILLMGFFVTSKGVLNVQAATRTRLNYTSVKIAQGETKQVKVLGMRGRKVKWTSNNSKIVTVEKGKITALKGYAL